MATGTTPRLIELTYEAALTAYWRKQALRQFLTGSGVSISGYTPVAIDSASGPGTTLLILDASHLFHMLSGNGTFADTVSRARRHASQTGEAFWRVGAR